jgi:hypothetical protein
MRFLLIVAGMLTLAVSASLTPANAGVFYCDNVVCVCQSKCRFPYPVQVPLPSQYLACIASCGRTEGGGASLAIGATGTGESEGSRPTLAAPTNK